MMAFGRHGPQLVLFWWAWIFPGAIITRGVWYVLLCGIAFPLILTFVKSIFITYLTISH